MRGGLRSLVNPPSRLGDVDLKATRVERERIHDEVRDRQFIAWLLEASVPGDGLISLAPMVVPSELLADQSPP